MWSSLGRADGNASPDLVCSSTPTFHPLHSTASASTSAPLTELRVSSTRSLGGGRLGNFVIFVLVLRGFGLSNGSESWNSLLDGGLRLGWERWPCNWLGYLNRTRLGTGLRLRLGTGWPTLGTGLGGLGSRGGLGTGLSIFLFLGFWRRLAASHCVSQFAL